VFENAATAGYSFVQLENFSAVTLGGLGQVPRYEL